MPRIHHDGLNCELGSLAITCKSKFSINLGIIVMVEDSIGLMHWPELQGAVHVWQVRVCSSASTLCYYLPRKGELKYERIGLIPDCFLRSLTPITGQMRFEFEAYEPNPYFEPVAL